MYVALALAGLGMGLAFSAMTNLIVEAVPATQTGVATGMNANIRTVGGAIGSQVVVSVITSGVVVGTLPHERGYVLSFLVMSAGLTAAGLAALLVPSAGRRAGLAPAAADVAAPLAERGLERLLSAAAGRPAAAFPAARPAASRGRRRRRPGRRPRPPRRPGGSRSCRPTAKASCARSPGSRSFTTDPAPRSRAPGPRCGPSWPCAAATPACWRGRVATATVLTGALIRP